MSLIYDWDSDIRLLRSGAKKHPREHYYHDIHPRIHNLDGVSESIYKELAALDDAIGEILDEKVKASSSDTAAGYLDSKVRHSVEVSSNYIQLSNDEDSPGNNYYYGTNSSGTKGYHQLTNSDEKVKASASDTAGYLDAKVKNSIEVDSNDLQLVGDSASPGNNMMYATNDSGEKGWYERDKFEGYEVFNIILVNNETEFLAAFDTLSANGGIIGLADNITLTADRSIDTSGIEIWGLGHNINFGNTYGSIVGGSYKLTVTGNTAIFDKVGFVGNVDFGDGPTDSQQLIEVDTNTCSRLDMFGCTITNCIGTNSITNPFVQFINGNTSKWIIFRMFGCTITTRHTGGSDRAYSGLGVDLATAFASFRFEIENLKILPSTLGTNPYDEIANGSKVYITGSAPVAPNGGKVFFTDESATLGAGSIANYQEILPPYSARVSFGTDDPTSVAKFGMLGHLYLRTSTNKLYVKRTNNGLNTNWEILN